MPPAQLERGKTCNFELPEVQTGLPLESRPFANVVPFQGFVPSERNATAIPTPSVVAEALISAGDVAGFILRDAVSKLAC